MLAGAAKTVFAAMTLVKIVHPVEFDLNHRNDDKLGDALQRIQLERCLPPVPAGNKNLALIIRIDQSDQIAQDNSVFMTKPRAR